MRSIGVLTSSANSNTSTLKSVQPSTSRVHFQSNKVIDTCNSTISETSTHTDSDASNDIDSTDEEEDLGASTTTNPMHLHIQGYLDIQDPIMQCKECQAMMWYDERMDKYRDATNPKFTLCCGNGKVQLPLLQRAPQLLQHLLFNKSASESKNCQQNIRIYNKMFAFTSLGAKVDTTINNGKGPPTIRIQGQPCHRIGSLLPPPGDVPKFAQLYIYDTEYKVQNRLDAVSDRNIIDPNIVSRLAAMLCKILSYGER